MWHHVATTHDILETSVEWRIDEREIIARPIATEKVIGILWSKKIVKRKKIQNIWNDDQKFSPIRKEDMETAWTRETENK